MNKHIISGLLMAAALTPAAAAPLFSGKQSPDDHVNRRTIALCMLLGVGLRGLKRRVPMRTEGHPSAHAYMRQSQDQNG